MTAARAALHALAPLPGPAFDLTVAVVSWRSLALLCQSARSWRAGQGGLRVEWRVVENGTHEPVARALRAVHPGIHVKALPRSVGFAKACNLALRHAKGRHVALLNPDTILTPGALEHLVRFLDDHPEVGIVGPKVFDDPARTRLQRSFRRFPTLLTALFHRGAVLSRLWPGNPWTRRYLSLDCPTDLPRATDWVSGCCLVVRGTLLAALGGLDERYPLFLEDVDLCRAAADAGSLVAWVPGAEVVHWTGGSRCKAPLRSEWLRHRSLTHWVRKHYRSWNPLSWALIAGVWCRFLAVMLPRGVRRRRRPGPRSTS